MQQQFYDFCFVAADPAVVIGRRLPDQRSGRFSGRVSIGGSRICQTRFGAAIPTQVSPFGQDLHQFALKVFGQRARAQYSQRLEGLKLDGGKLRRERDSVSIVSATGGAETQELVYGKGSVFASQ